MAPERLLAAFRLDPRHPEDWTAWTLRVALAGAFLWYFVTDSRLVYTTGPVLSGAVGLGLVGAFGFALASATARRPRAVRVAESLWSLLFMCHFLGHAAELYLTAYYDLALHASAGVLGGVVAFLVARSTGAFWDAGGATPFRAFFVVIGVVAVGGVVVELGEFAVDAYLGTAEQADPLQSGLDDTMTDMLAQSATSLVVATGAAAAVARRPAPAPAAAKRRPRPAAKRA